MSLTLIGYDSAGRRLPSIRLRALPRGTGERLLAWIPFFCSLPLTVAVWYTVGDEVLVASLCTGMNMLLALNVAWLERRRARALDAARTMATEVHDGARRYRAIVDTAADAIVITDQRGIIRSFNAAAERMFGHSVADAVGNNIGMLMPGPVRSLHDALAKDSHSAADCRQVGHARTTEGRRCDGSLFPVDLSVAEWYDGANELCFTVIMRDVTGRQRAQEELRQAKEQAELAARTEADLRQRVEAANGELEAANGSLHKFTAIVAHDLRAPLRRVEAFVDVLRSDYSAAFDEDGADILCRIERGSARMRVMLDALLDYSRCDGSAVRDKAAHIGSVVADTIEHVDLAAVAAELRVDLGGVSHVEGDPVLLSHVVQNLIGNAIKFRGAAKPVIEVAAAQAGDVVTVSVTDNGIGIEPEFAEHVFGMFCRLHDEDEYEGSGIGLAVCRKIIHDHGGRIWVDPTYVGGTRIQFTLVPAPEPASALPVAAMGHCRIARAAAPARLASTVQ